MTTPTHDLALARAERDAWQSTCEELHRAIAGRDVEIESHLGRCEAADQRARSLDAALTAEREAGRGLVAQVDALRKDLAHAQERLAERRTAQRGEVERLEAERDRLRDELRAIRDLVAPGNPQGTVVDAVRAHVAAHQRPCNGDCDIALARRQVGPDGDVPGNARECAEMWEREAARVEAERDDARRVQAETTTALVTADRELAKLRAELAELTITRDRLLAREHEDGRLHAQLRAEIAELRARPVLGVDYALRSSPVTLPSPDRAEELCRRYHDSTSTIGIARGPAWSEYSDEGRAGRVSAMHKELTALAKLSPAPAPALDAAFLRRVLVATKHGPGGKGGPGLCDAACVKCEAERMVRAASAREVAPTLVAVSDEELVAAFAQAHLECPCDESGEEWAKYPPDCCNAAGIRAVRAKLGAAEVTEERLREAIREERHVSSFVAEDTAKGVLARLRATAAKGG